jgi:SAM-dependent methyltransferase
MVLPMKSGSAIPSAKVVSWQHKNAACAPQNMQNELLDQCLVCNSRMLNMLDPVCNIAQCRSCGFVFDNPRPALADLIDFYSKPGKYDSWLEESDARDRLWQRRLKKLRSTRKPGSLLDVGTGIGQFLAIARGTYNPVYGTEVSGTAVEIAKEKYGLDLFHGTLESLCDQGKTFDNITLFHVLEHVPDPRSVLEKCHSLLSADGRLVIAVPNEVTSLRALKRRLFNKIAKSKSAGILGLPRIVLDGSVDEIHLSHFTPPVLHRLIKTTGFSIIESTLDPYYVPKGPHLKADFYYYVCVALLRLFRINVYDAMLVIARKGPALAVSTSPVR